jgi:hypothetical protein
METNRPGDDTQVQNRNLNWLLILSSIESSFVNFDSTPASLLHISFNNDSIPGETGGRGGGGVGGCG